MSRFFPIQAFLRHWLVAVDEHSIHSPFFFELYRRVLKGTDVPADGPEFEALRSRLLQNKLTIAVDDFGSGAVTLPTRQRALDDIAATSLAPASRAAFYYRLVQRFQPKVAIELGTSLGITSLYLAARAETQLYTFEGSPAVASVALTNFESFQKKNIELVEGNIDETLGDFLQSHRRVDFALLDANHRYDPTLDYFEQLAHRATESTLFVLDDIHRSEGMEKAWTEIRQHPLIYGSVDLFHCGIVFFEPALNRQHFIWEF